MNEKDRVKIDLDMSNGCSTSSIHELTAIMHKMKNGNFKTIDSLKIKCQQNQELQEQQEKMRIHLLKEVINTLEEERKIISRELLDKISQSLISLLLGLKLIQEVDDINMSKKLASNFREVICKTIEDIQCFSYKLRPSALDDLGLCVALKRYVKELSSYNGINIEYDQQDCKDIRLSPAVEITVYRIVQEALNNVIRHARAKNVRISFKNNHNNIETIIEDDGNGFDFNALPKNQECLGLFGMKERASLVGGILLIDTKPGRGTKIFLKVPRE